MKQLHRMVLAMVVAGCGGEVADEMPAGAQGTDSAVSPAVAPQIPEAPRATRGRFAVSSAGPIGLEGDWSARAGHCVTPPMLQLLVQDDVNGLLLLLALPEDGARLTTYPVTVVTEGVPIGPAAQMGVQRIVDGRPHAWQALEGEAEVFGWEDDRISGRVAVTLRNIANDQPSALAGGFLGVPVVELPPEQCIPADSTPATN